MPTLQEFYAMLEKHDWTFEYANGEAHYRGKAQRQELIALTKRDAEFLGLYNAYREHIFNHTPKPALPAGAGQKEGGNGFTPWQV